MMVHRPSLDRRAVLHYSVFVLVYRRTNRFAQLDENVPREGYYSRTELPMRRIHFIELHDQPWCPSTIRDGVTDALQFGFHLFQVYGPIVPLLQRLIDSTGTCSIVDMCSGGGGPWLDLSRRLQSHKLPRNTPPLQICLTDKYPNLAAFQKIEAASSGRISLSPQSVDATNVPRELKGLRTMFTSFHHFSPDMARAILQNAVDSGEGIAIFEAPRRAPFTIGLVLPWILILSILTLWIRPFRWSRLLWTYLVPITPLVLIFDGVVSCLRTYRPSELRELVQQLTASDYQYQWEIGEDSTGTTPITYLIGYPQACAVTHAAPVSI